MDPHLQLDIVAELDLVNTTLGVTQVAGLHNASKAFLFQGKRSMSFFFWHGVGIGEEESVWGCAHLLVWGLYLCCLSLGVIPKCVISRARSESERRQGTEMPALTVKCSPKDFGGHP